MQNFENKLSKASNSLKNIRGILETNKVELRLKEIEETLQEDNFWKNKELVKKTIKQKKIFEDILNSFNVSSKELANLKDLYSLASQEKDDETIKDCFNKIEEINKI